MQDDQKAPNEVKKCQGCLQLFPLGIFNGKSRCPSCAVKSRFFSKQYRERQKLLPIPDGKQRCVDCRKDFDAADFGGVKSCLKCRDRANKKSAQRWLSLSIAIPTDGNFVCKSCGKEFPNDGKKMCPTCREKQKSRVAKYRSSIHSQPITVGRRCRQCLQILPVNIFGGEFLTCSPCREKDSNYRKLPEMDSKRRVRAKAHRAKHRAQLSAKSSQYYYANKAALRIKRRAYVLNKFKTDPIFKLQHRARSRIFHVLKNLQLGKTCKSTELLGCDWKTFKEHIEKQFKPGMSWENYGFYGWHADHRRPISSFDLSDVEQQRTAFHYTNTQPLWWWENFSKGDKMPEGLAA